VASLGSTSLVAVEVIRDFSAGYHSRNGGGDLIQTDGDLPIVNARNVPVPADRSEVILSFRYISGRWGFCDGGVQK